MAGPYDVIARAQARDINELGKLVASRVQGPRRRDADDELPGHSPIRTPIAVDHHTTIHQLDEGGVQAVCSCGWRSPVFGADKTAGTMDPLQRAADAGDLHEWEMSLP
jgi:hypothetical protein